jgi:hypothetical protein
VGKAERFTSLLANLPLGLADLCRFFLVVVLPVLEIF